MSSKKITTMPNLSDASPVHQSAIAAGPEHFSSWQYNVADHLKGKSVEDIKQSLKETAFPFAVCMENWISDFNFSSLCRNANAFGAQEIFYLGTKKFDRRGCVGVYNYSDINWLPTVDDFIKLKEKYDHIIGIDNITGSVPLSTFNFKPKTLLVFGSEGVGLTETIQSLCDGIVHINMFGSVRSLNCAVASGIVMNSFVEQMSIK